MILFKGIGRLLACIVVQSSHTPGPSIRMRITADQYQVCENSYGMSRDAETAAFLGVTARAAVESGSSSSDSTEVSATGPNRRPNVGKSYHVFGPAMAAAVRHARGWFLIRWCRYEVV